MLVGVCQSKQAGGRQPSCLSNRDVRNLSSDQGKNVPSKIKYGIHIRKPVHGACEYQLMWLPTIISNWTEVFRVDSRRNHSDPVPVDRSCKCILIVFRNCQNMLRVLQTEMLIS